MYLTSSLPLLVSSFKILLPSSLPPYLTYLFSLHSQEGTSVSQAHVNFSQPHILPPSYPLPPSHPPSFTPSPSFTRSPPSYPLHHMLSLLHIISLHTSPTFTPSHLNLHTHTHSFSPSPTHPPSSHPHITRKQISPRKARQASSISRKKKHGVDPLTTPSDSQLNV